MDDIILNKVAIIERCLIRIETEYNEEPDRFKDDFTRQDSVILNIERAIQACIDIGTHIIRTRRLNIPQTSREVFAILKDSDIIPGNLSYRLQKMVGFRNIAVHDYQKLNLEIIINIVKNHLTDFHEFKEMMIKYSPPK